MSKKVTMNLVISIHAPTRGATITRITFFLLFQFQSTLLQEERHDQKRFFNDYIIFQSTLLQEERLNDKGNI